jgi:hypothetical protein
MQSADFVYVKSNRFKNAQPRRDQARWPMRLSAKQKMIIEQSPLG